MCLRSYCPCNLDLPHRNVAVVLRGIWPLVATHVTWALPVGINPPAQVWLHVPVKFRHAVMFTLASLLATLHCGTAAWRGMFRTKAIHGYSRLAALEHTAAEGSGSVDGHVDGPGLSQIEGNNGCFRRNG
jgi:hypothetical protein